MKTLLRSALPVFVFLIFTTGKVLATPITLELSGGSNITGELIKWDGQNATIKAEFGEVVLKKEQISQKSLQNLALSSGDASALKARIAELESTVESLRRDNAALRQQLQATASNPVTAPRQTSTAITSQPAGGSATEAAYWISSTGKRHNSGCRYYRNCQGRPGTASEGVACKICGGYDRACTDSAGFSPGLSKGDYSRVTLTTQFSGDKKLTGIAAVRLVTHRKTRK